MERWGGADMTVTVDLYARFSRAEGDRETDSIENQVNLLKQYANEKGWEINEIHRDDGFSGTNYNRPGFQSMMRNVQGQRINAILAKDQSRFGRSIENEIYFQSVLPLSNVFFIGVTDNVNTLEGNELVRQIGGVFNENYSRDISTKVRAALKAKQKNGQFTGSFAPYGYLKDPNDRNKLIIDEEVVPVIDEIIRLYLDGMGLVTIARTLNDRGISSPSRRKKEMGMNYKNPNSKMLWSPSTIRKILTSETYIGTLVQHKTEKLSFKLKNKKQVKKEQNIRVDNVVPPIIDLRTWELVQKQVQIRTREIKNSSCPIPLAENTYSGLLFCNDCGSKMVYRSDYQGYTCGTYAKYGIKHCTRHGIKKYLIDEVCLNSIRQDMKLIMDINLIIKQIEKKNKDSPKFLEKEISKKEQRLADIKAFLKELREEKSRGLVEEEEYIELREEYKIEEKELKQAIGELERQNKKSALDWWTNENLDVFERYARLEIREMTRELALQEFEKIMVTKDGKIKKIIKNGKSPRELVDELNEMDSGAL